jgi:hypothetical protein
MSYKSKMDENPVGPESPTFVFPFSRGQVLAGLLVLAVGLTAWKQYQEHFIAPRTAVAWQPFSLEQVATAERRHVDMLILIEAAGESSLAAELDALITCPAFQKACFLARPAALRVTSVAELGDESRRWLLDQLGKSTDLAGRPTSADSMPAGPVLLRITATPPALAIHFPATGATSDQMVDALFDGN